MTFICTDNQWHQDALALESHINKLEERSWEVAVDSSMSGKMKVNSIIIYLPCERVFMCTVRFLFVSCTILQRRVVVYLLWSCND